MILYRRLFTRDLDDDVFGDFIRRQNVTKCLRKENGEWVVKDDPFIDDWSEKDYKMLIDYLKKLILSKGFVYAAFYKEKIKGFASVAFNFFGKDMEYLDLTNLHVSQDMRRKGIGRILFFTAAKWAKNRGAKKLYISAHSALETQNFYKAMGCVEAAEYNMAHVEKEPFDCQLELDLYSSSVFDEDFAFFQKITQ